ncbi:MAG: electron transfer flavoprotein subunit alpha/FixB family protein [Reinekea sp.]
MSNVIRRDPRAQWIARNRLHPLHQATVETEVRGPSGLIRKNPHAVGFIGPNGIKRIDRLAGNAAHTTVRRSTSQEAVEVQLPLHTVEQAEFYVAVVVDLVGGRLTSHDKDVLGQGHQLVNASAQNGAVVAVVFAGSDSDIKEQGFDLAGADRLMVITGKEYDGYSPENKIAILQSIDLAISPRHWLFPDSQAGGHELGIRLAARLAERAATGVWKVSADQISCRGGGDLTDISRPLTRILVLAEECADPVDEFRCEAKLMPLEQAPESISRIQDLGPVSVDPSQIALAEAEFILSAGNGIRNWDQFHAVATQLGATEGASRVAVDDGFMPRERQVGATGTWVSARVYVAVGISGAIQHLQGIGQCEKVIAINIDAGCDMVKRANLSVIGDSEEILQALSEKLNQQKVVDDVA